MKAARLVSLLLSVQARGTATAEQLAAEFGVSVRTVYRDVADLQAAGVPVYGERGDGGGYRLVGGYRTTLTGLTSDEAGAVLLTGAPGPAAQLGLGSVLASTRLKLLAAVPRGLRDAATRGEQRFHLDPGGWAHTADDDFVRSGSSAGEQGQGCGRPTQIPAAHLRRSRRRVTPASES